MINYLIKLNLSWENKPSFPEIKVIYSTEVLTIINSNKTLKTLHTWYVWIGLKYSSISLMASHCAERRKRERGKHSWVSHMFTHLHLFQIHMQQIVPLLSIFPTWPSVPTCLPNHIGRLLALTSNETREDDCCHTGGSHASVAGVCLNLSVFSRWFQTELELEWCTQRLNKLNKHC